MGIDSGYLYKALQFAAFALFPFLSAVDFSARMTAFSMIAGDPVRRTQATGCVSWTYINNYSLINRAS